MSSARLLFEDRMDGSDNFSPWKECITVLFQELELWDIVGASDTITIPTDDAMKTVFEKKDIKVQIFFLDSIKDHVIPHIIGKLHSFDIWEALCTLYHSKNDNIEMVLREKLRNMKMIDADTVTTYLTKISQVRDELGAAGEKVEDEELVRYALNGFTAKWNTFVQGVVAREKLPD